MHSRRIQVWHGADRHKLRAVAATAKVCSSIRNRVISSSETVNTIAKGVSMALQNDGPILCPTLGQRVVVARS